MDLLDVLLNGLLENSDDISSDWSDFWSWLWISDSDNGSLDGVNLSNVLLDDLIEDNDLSSNDWSLLDWNSWDLLSQNLDSLVNLSDALLDVNNILVKDLDNLLSDWGQWSWQVGWFFWFFSSWGWRRKWLGQSVSDMSTGMVFLAVFVTNRNQFLTRLKEVRGWVLNAGLLARIKLVLAFFVGFLVFSASLLDNNNLWLNQWFRNNRLKNKWS